MQFFHDSCREDHVTDESGLNDEEFQGILDLRFIKIAELQHDDEFSGQKQNSYRRRINGCRIPDSFLTFQMRTQILYEKL